MKNLIQCSVACWLTFILFAALSAGCTRVEEPELPPPMPADAAPAFDPLMATARDWLQARKFSYTTNVEIEETSFHTFFADLPGDADSASCFIHNGTNGDTLTINALLSPQSGKDQGDQVNNWVAEANSHSQWGFFGFDGEERRVWFRIALFRPAGKASAEDMDRLINEVVGAIHQWRQFIEEHDQMLPPASEGNNTNLLEGRRQGAQRAKVASILSKSSLINYLAPVNYVRLQNKKK